MEVFDPLMQRTVVVLDTPPNDGLVISYSNSDFDDMIACENQLLDSSSARSFMQDEFRRSAQNLLEAGSVISVFC